MPQGAKDRKPVHMGPRRREHGKTGDQDTAEDRCRSRKDAVVRSTNRPRFGVIVYAIPS